MIDQTSEFTRIYEESYEKVLKYIVCHCDNLEDANDILQETYLDFYRALDKHEIQNVEHYLMGIVRNKVRKHYTLLYRLKSISLFSQLKDTEEIEFVELIADDTNLEEELMMHLDAEEVWNHLKKKRQVIQKVFMLYFYFEMTHKEIAEELSVNESYVKNCLYRTLKEIRKEMDEHVER